MTLSSRGLARSIAPVAPVGSGGGCGRRTTSGGAVGGAAERWKHARGGQRGGAADGDSG